MRLAVDFTAIFKAQDKVSKTLKDIDRSGGALSGTFNKLATAAAGVFTVAKVVEFGKGSADAFANFESGMNEVFTLLPDVSQDAMDQLTQQAKQLGKDLSILPDEVVPALYQSLSAGVPQDNVFEFLETSFKAATGGVATLETAVDGLSTVVNSYGADVIDVNRASDLMFTTVRLGKTTFSELSSSLFNVLPASTAAGVSFDDVSASLATLTAQGVPTSVATVQMRNVINELADSTKGVGKSFKKLSGKTFKNFIKEGGNVQDALQVLEKSEQAANLGIESLFSSVESKNAALALTGKGTESFSKALGEMGSAIGATDKAFEKMDTGLKDTFDDFKANIEWLKVEVGGKLAGAFNWLWNKSSPVFKNISQGFKNLKGIITEFGFSGTIENVFGADAGDIAKMAEDYAIAYVGGIKKIFSGDFQGGFTDILKAMGFDDKSLSVIIQFVSGVQNNFLKLASFVKPIFATIKNTIFSIMPTLQNMINFFTQTLLPISQSVFGFIVTNVISPFVAFWQENVPKLATIFNNAWLVLQPIFQALASAFMFIWNIAQPVIDNIINRATGLASAIFTILDGIVQFIAGVFAGDWQKAWSGIVKIFSGIWDGIVAIFKSPINWIIDGLNSFFQGLNKIKVPDWVPGVGGKGINIPEIPKLAVGSKDSPNTFIAGEKGPELITGAEGSRVFPSDETDRIISALERQNAPLMVSTSPFGNDGYNDEPVQREKTININLNGNGTIRGSGISKDEILEYLIVHLKPILMSIIETEIFEEGDLSYEY